MDQDFLERSILSLKDKRKDNVQLIGGAMNCLVTIKEQMIV